MESISSQNIIGKFNSIKVITAHRDKNFVRTTIQENIYIFNKIRHIQALGEKIISLPMKPPSPDHIGFIVKSPLRSEWYDSIFTYYEKMEKSTTFSAPFLCSLLPPDTKILHSRIYFRVNTTYIDNQYDLYSRTCADGSSIIEGVDSTVSYAPVAGIRYLRIIVSIAFAEGLIIFCLGNIQHLPKYYSTQ